MTDFGGTKIMIITKDAFYLEELDTSIPAVGAAVEFYRDGKEREADHAFAEYLKSIVAPDKYFGVIDKEVSPAPWDGKEELSVLEIADRNCRGQVCQAKTSYDYGGEIDWNYNGSPDGYREWLWHLNRHNMFKTLGYAYILTGDEKYAAAFERHIRGWIAQAECPQWPVPNRSAAVDTWRTLEASSRQRQSWPYAIHAFINSPTIGDETWVLIAMSQWEHGQMLRYSQSTVNWYVAEMSALVTLSSIFPYFKKSTEWREFAINMLDHELRTEVYPDGFQCELTTGYQNSVITTFGSAWKIMRQYGMPVPESFKSGMRLLFTMYPKLMRPDGKTPVTNDGGRADVMAFMRRALLELGEDEEFSKILDGRIGEVYPRDVVMPWSGMITMRTGWGPEDIWLFFESAPFGAGHQHNDKLNINLFAYGKNLIDVIGNYAYDGSVMRHYCRSTRGHNTGIVDGKGQNAGPTHTPWSPEKVNIKSDLEVNICEDTVVAYGKYNRGYGGALTDVTHERKVVFFRHGLGGSKPFFVILDDFTAGDGERHRCEASYQLLDMPVTVNGRHATVDAGDGVTLEIVTHAALTTVTGQNQPEYMGFRPAASRLVPEHIPAPVLSISGYGECVHLATVLYPTPDGVAPEIKVACDESSFTVTLDGVEHRFERNCEFLVTEKV